MKRFFLVVGLFSTPAFAATYSGMLSCHSAEDFCILSDGSVNAMIMFTGRNATRISLQNELMIEDFKNRCVKVIGTVTLQPSSAGDYHRFLSLEKIQVADEQDCGRSSE